MNSRINNIGDVLNKKIGRMINYQKQTAGDTDQIDNAGYFRNDKFGWGAIPIENRMDLKEYASMGGSNTGNMVGI